MELTNEQILRALSVVNSLGAQRLHPSTAIKLFRIRHALLPAFNAVQEAARIEGLGDGEQIPSSILSLTQPIDTLITLKERDFDGAMLSVSDIELLGPLFSLD